PACEACNKGTSRDDEYFRQIAMAYETPAGSPDADAVCETIVRSFRREKAAGLRARFFETVRPVHVWTMSGLYAGKSFTYTLEADRLQRTAAKIVKGLFFHISGYPLPDGYGSVAVTAESFCEVLKGPEGAQ